MSKCKNIVVTGANRGIGLEMVKQILTRFNPENLIATYRDAATSKELLELAEKHKNVYPVVLDMKARDKFDQFAAKVNEITKGAGINLLINNAGIAHVAKNSILSELDSDDILLQFEVNSLAPIMLSKAFLPQLEKASKSSSDAPLGIGRAAVLNLSTAVASIADNSGGKIYGYRMSKTALNQATKNMSLELKEQGILVIPLHPGWVKTDMGGPNALIDSTESVSGILNVLEKLDENMNGKFMRFDGKEAPW